VSLDLRHTEFVHLSNIFLSSRGKFRKYLCFQCFLYRGCYMGGGGGRRYEFYFRGVKQRVSKLLFLPRENKIHIFKSPCNFLFII